MRTAHFLAVIRQEGDGYVALWTELDIASEASTVEEARLMLKEAVELFLECASEEETGWQAVGGPCYIVPMECTVA